MARMLAPESGVKVRMYRQGLGDCFLLAFPAEDGKTFYMLIDCGVILGTKMPEKIMSAVAEDIREATGGDIHLLAVTHEHWDHVSGFLQAKTVFQELRIHNLWFAWTEDPKDDLAQRLQKEFGKDLEGLRLALQKAGNTNAITQVADLLGFFGETALGTAAITPKNTKAALVAVREMAKTCGTEPQYRRPGEGPLPLRADGIEVAGARVFILGPPHDEKMLRRINPTTKGKEVYTEGASVTARTAFLMAVQDEASLSSEDREMRDLSFPFDERLRIPPRDAKRMQFFQGFYGFDDLPLGRKAGASTPTTLQSMEGAPPGDQKIAENAEPPSASRHPQAWRRIDDDWLGTSGEIALQLDSYTNNTSLVMAIELIDTGKILLFVADAQVGNWLSWDGLSWTADENKVMAADLLARTVLYKVGHHGSHNATVRGLGDEKRGLEVMTSPELVALIPVNHAMAAQKHWNKMPFTPLLQRLREKAAGRVFRVDDPFPRQQTPEGMTDTAWESFKKRFHETELYMEYTVAG